MSIECATPVSVVLIKEPMGGTMGGRLITAFRVMHCKVNFTLDKGLKHLHSDIILGGSVVWWLARRTCDRKVAY